MATIRITWDDPNPPYRQETEVRIYRNTSPFDAGSLPAVLATLAPDVEEYEDNTVVPGTSYWYAVGLADATDLALAFISQVYVAGTIFSETAAFGAGTVALSGQTIEGTLFGEADDFGAGAIVQPRTIEGSLFSAADVFGAGSVIATTEFTVTIASGTVVADLPNFVFPVHLADMPPSFWAAVRSDGGNVRVYANDGVTMIPHDMAFIDKDMQVGLLFVRRTVASASATVVTVKLLNSGTTKLAATDANGRNAVWSEYEVAVVFPENISRVDGSSPSLAGSPYESPWKEIKSITLASDQGTCFDGTNYYASSTSSLRKYSSTGTLLVTNSTVLDSMIAATGDSTLDHCGAPAIIDGELWVPIQEYPASPYNSQFIGRFALTDLAFLGYIPLTGATRESSGVYYDADLDRLYVTDYTVNTNIPYFDKTTGAYEGQLTLSTNIPKMQGMSEYAGKYYVNSEQNGVYEIEKDGTVNGMVLRSTYSGSPESVDFHDDELILHQSASNITRHFKRVPELQGWPRIHGQPIGYQRAKSTIWTMAVSWYATPSVNQQAIIGVRSATSPSDRHSGMYDAPSSNGFGLWNTTNGWLYTSPRTAPASFNRYRAAFAQNDTLARKISVNGIKNSAGSSSPRPTTAANVIYEIAGAAESEPGFGYYQFAWVRHEYMSDAWIDADYLSFTNPSAFYTIN